MMQAQKMVLLSFMKKHLKIPEIKFQYYFKKEFNINTSHLTLM